MYIRGSEYKFFVQRQYIHNNQRKLFNIYISLSKIQKYIILLFIILQERYKIKNTSYIETFWIINIKTLFLCCKNLKIGEDMLDNLTNHNQSKTQYWFFWWYVLYFYFLHKISSKCKIGILNIPKRQ